MKRKITAYTITTILFTGFLFLFWKTQNSAFLVISILITGLSLLLFTMGKLLNVNGKPLENITIKEAKTKIAVHKDTSNWCHTKGIITRFIPFNKIVEDDLINIIFVCVVLTVLFSCQNENKSKSNQQSGKVFVVKSDSTKVVAKEFLFSKTVEILLPTQYRKESTGYPKDVKEKEWFEIYKDMKTNQWKIGKADLKITYGRDECVGEEVMIIKSNQENTALFLTPFEGLSENPITVLENKPLFPERNVSFDFKGKEYQLLPMGTCIDENGKMMTTSEVKAKKEEDLMDNTKISGYRLSFGEAGNSQEIVVENIEFSTPRVIWAGDLNNDSLLDLILDLPDFYESRHLFFFLSDENDAEKPLKKVAELFVVNDC